MQHNSSAMNSLFMKLVMFLLLLIVRYADRQMLGAMAIRRPEPLANIIPQQYYKMCQPQQSKPSPPLNNEMDSLQWQIV